MERVDPCLLGVSPKGLRATMSIGVNCPLRCAHCYQEGMPREAQDRDLNILSLERMADAGVSKLYWDGAEPMTNPDIEDYLDTIATLRKRPGTPPYVFERVSIATSGFVVTKERAESLYDKGLRNIMVSIDGANARTHDRFRMLGSFRAAVQATELLADIGYTVRIGTTIWSGNVAELEEIAALAEKVGASEVAFNWLQPAGNALRHSENAVPDDVYGSVSARMGEMRRTRGIGIVFHRGGEADPSSMCNAGRNIVYVAGGRVWPCSWVRVAAPQYGSVMGLREHTLTYILENDPNIQEFRRMARENCMHGKCPAVTAMFTGSFDGTDPIQPGGVHRR